MCVCVCVCIYIYIQGDRKVTPYFKILIVYSFAIISTKIEGED